MSDPYLQVERTYSLDGDDGGAGDGVVVAQGVAGGGEDGVSLAGNGVGHSAVGVAALDGDGRVDGAGNVGPRAVELAGELDAGGLQGDHAVLPHRGGVLEGQSREGGEWQGVVAIRAGLDESRGQGVDLVRIERNIEWGWEGRLGMFGVDVVADVGVVAGLDGQDGAGGSQVRSLRDGGGSAEIGGDTNALEHAGGCNEGRNIVSKTEVVCGRDMSARNVTWGHQANIQVQALVGETPAAFRAPLKNVTWVDSS